jgi:predicted nuclease with TOPRIM domain
LDSKYETISKTYSGKIKSLTDFVDITEKNIRQLQDVKANSELHVEEFMTKYKNKLGEMQDQIRSLSNKTSSLDSHHQDISSTLSRVKHQVTEVLKDRSVTQRIELLESKLHEDYLKGHISMHIDISLSERLKHISSDYEGLQHQIRNIKDHLSSLDPTLNKKVDEFRRKFDTQVQGMISKVKTEFLFK